jgi:hypothetical protein
VRLFPAACVAPKGVDVDALTSVVTERLKKELLALEQESRARGAAVGKKWVMALQLSADILAVRRLAAQFPVWRKALGRDVVFGPYTAAEKLVFLMYPQHSCDRKTARRFWALHAGEPCPDDDFVEGFGAAAVEAWQQVKRSR